MAAPVAPADQGAPPLPHRRPRVREVSSRFMSPAAASSSAGDLHSLSMKSPISRSKYAISTPAPERSSKPSQRRLLLRSQEQEPFSCCSHENIPEMVRSLDTPFQHAKPETLRKQRPVKFCKENGYGDQIAKSTSIRTAKSCRPDTPTAATCGASDRVVPSRFRLPQRQTSSSVTDAAKLLQSTGLSFSSSNLVSQTPSANELEPIQGGSCPNSPLSSQHTRNRALHDTRSSMTEEDTLSTRLLVRSSSGSNTIASGNCQTSSKFSTPSLCSRSLNLPISASQNSFKSSDRTLCKPPTTSMENRTLPPQPTSMKLGVDSRKGKRPHSSQEDAHSLKLFHNHYLLWRYANAKAQVSMDAQRAEMENQFFSLGADISRLRDSVKRKQVELAALQQMKALSTILEAQMPYLDEWSALEEDYTCSLSAATNALTNSLLRLPVSGNVQVNIKEAAEALDSSVKTMDTIIHDVQRFLPKAEEMDVLMSELATIADVEKALVEECGSILAKTHISQLEDCSLRGHLMQLRCSNLF
ncbi:protein ENDOSPERM DEFECTIVE 1 [Cynara cardunculus var. scolymus]|uniref:protein ENDOSPERM DEFECTIVE 1 n=1 Tax=Cynara cardunculus var. scolymus TaxID=59895 RepID=UPI000D6312F1|nr:protein ENDOSPERM DEFECTIVE 1 [Cynara cardunculus var. scolymus]